MPVTRQGRNDHGQPSDKCGVLHVANRSTTRVVLHRAMYYISIVHEKSFSCFGVDSHQLNNLVNWNRTLGFFNSSFYQQET